MSNTHANIIMSNLTKLSDEDLSDLLSQVSLSIYHAKIKQNTQKSHSVFDELKGYRPQSITKQQLIPLFIKHLKKNNNDVVLLATEILVRHYLSQPFKDCMLEYTDNHDIDALYKKMLDLRKENIISIDPYTWIKLVNNDDSKLPNHIKENNDKNLLEELFELGKYQIEDLEKQVKQLELANKKLLEQNVKLTKKNEVQLKQHKEELEKLKIKETQLLEKFVEKISRNLSNELELDFNKEVEALMGNKTYPLDKIWEVVNEKEKKLFEKNESIDDLKKMIAIKYAIVMVRGN